MNGGMYGMTKTLPSAGSEEWVRLPEGWTQDVLLAWCPIYGLAPNKVKLLAAQLDSENTHILVEFEGTDGQGGRMTIPDSTLYPEGPTLH